jgi:hypothetical protein
MNRVRAWGDRELRSIQMPPEKSSEIHTKKQELHSIFLDVCDWNTENFK